MIWFTEILRKVHSAILAPSSCQTVPPTIQLLYVNEKLFLLAIH